MTMPYDDPPTTPSPQLRVDGQPLHVIVGWLQRALAAGSTSITLDVPDPDSEPQRRPGERRSDGAPQRSWRAWLDLAEGLACRCATPQPLGHGRVRLRFEPLGPEADWHRAGASVNSAGDADPERYAAPDGFAAVHKLEDPGFYLPLLDALERVRPPDGGRVLALGCHRGDELAALAWLADPPLQLELIGVDRSAGALRAARQRLPGARFVQADLAQSEAPPAELGRFHLIIAIDLLQSPSIDDKALLRRLVQRHLHDSAALLLGLPNSRFRGGEVTWGARTRNYRSPDLSLLVRDLAAYRRYLQQHGFVTHIGGRYDLLLSAWRRTSATTPPAPPCPAPAAH